VIGLFLFHALHRMYHSVHDFGVHVTPAMKAGFHGVALLGTLAAAYLVLVIGKSVVPSPLSRDDHSSPSACLPGARGAPH
jgi:hypothetical protein